MLNMLEFRLAKEKDLGNILAIVQAEHAQGKAADFQYDYAYLAQAISDTHMRWFVLEAANYIVGFISAYVDVKEGLAKINFAAVNTNFLANILPNNDTSDTEIMPEENALKFLLQPNESLTVIV